MAKKWTALTLAILFVVVGFLILYQQYVSFGVFFQIEDIHHETFAIAFIALGIGTLIGAGLTGRKER